MHVCLGGVGQVYIPKVRETQSTAKSRGCHAQGLLRKPVKGKTTKGKFTSSSPFLYNINSLEFHDRVLWVLGHSIREYRFQTS